MIPIWAEWTAQRHLRLFADRSTAHLRNDRERLVIRSHLLEIAEARRRQGIPVRLDPRFRLRIEPQDFEEGRLGYIVDRFNGLRYAEEVEFSANLERRLMACYQSAGLRFQWKKSSPLASIYIRLIDTTVGFGVFAARDLEEGELIGEYAGLVSVSDTVTDRTYCYEYPALHQGEEETTLVLDAAMAGNETRFINHAVAEVVTHDFEFYNGHWRVPFTVNCHIDRGEQLFIDYGSGYWEGSSRQPLTLSTREALPDATMQDVAETEGSPVPDTSGREELLEQPQT